MGEARPPASCECDRPRTCIDRQPGAYLIAVYRLIDDYQDRLPTGVVGTYLDVSAASVTEMFGKLDEEGVLEYEKHAGVALTERGESIARELARRQCIVRTFFSAELDAVLDPYVGYRIGYHLPASSIDRLAILVGEGPNAGSNDSIVHCEDCTAVCIANS